MNTIKTVGGRPVTGYIPTRYREERPEQKPIGDFLAALDKLFAFPEVESVRWSQYTPSFNDGDPCVFTTGQVYVKLVGVETGGEHEDGFFTEYCIDDHFSKADGVEYTWRNDKHHPIAKVLTEEFDCTPMEAYYDALGDTFGDPAEIVATRMGFHVEDYDCGY